MHYTHAVEYVTVLQGNLEVHGPGGEVSKLSQGDIFVSGAEAHQIVNAGSTPLREPPPDAMLAGLKQRRLPYRLYRLTADRDQRQGAERSDGRDEPHDGLLEPLRLKCTCLLQPTRSALR